MNSKLTVPATLLALLASACVLGPNYKEPALKPGVGFAVATPTLGGKDQQFSPADAVPERWWQQFGSPALNGWVDEALANNPSLASAEAALRRAQQLQIATGATALPSVNAAFNAARRKTSGASNGGKFSGSIFNLFDASVNVSYGLDLFGGVARTREAEAAAVDFQAYQARGAGLSIAGNVVTSAIALAQAQAEQAATLTITEGYRHTAALVQTQFRLGGIAKADVLSAQTLLAASEARLPALQQQVTVAQNRLAAYLGRFPSEFSASGFDLAALQLPARLPLSLPSALARQRPDVAAASAQLHQAAALVGVAEANRYPAITLTASAGTQAASFTDLFDQMIFSAAAGVTQPLFNAGRLKANQRAAEAAYEAAQADYKTTLIHAFGEVGNVLAALQADAQTLAARESAAGLAAESLRLARLRYQTGSSTLLTVLDAQRNDETARLNLVAAKGSRLADTAALYTALGGGLSLDNVAAARAGGTAPHQPEAPR